MASGLVNDPIKKTATFIYALGLGSNLGDMHFFVKSAKDRLCGSGIKLHYESPLYGTEPVGLVADKVFLNQLILVSSSLDPLQMLEQVQKIEKSLGRTRSVRWENRLIDIDIIEVWLGGKPHKVEHSRLKVPHPAIKDRWFLFQPLHNARRFLYNRLLKS